MSGNWLFWALFVFCCVASALLGGMVTSAVHEWRCQLDCDCHFTTRKEVDQ